MKKDSLAKELKKIKNEIYKTNKEIDIVIASILKNSHNEFILESAKVSKKVSDIYLDFMHYIENADLRNFLKDNPRIKTQIMKLKELRSKRRELKYTKEQKTILFQGKSLLDNYTSFNKYKKNPHYEYKTQEWREYAEVLKIGGVKDEG